MGDLLFSPNGEITPAQFMKAAYVLIIVSLMINTLPLVSVTVAGLAKFFFLAIAYCWIAIFMKRYRHGGKAPALCLIPAAVFAVFWFIISNMAVPALFGGDVYKQMTAEITDAKLGGEGWGAALQISQAYAEPLLRKTAIPGALVFAAFSLLIAFVFNKIIPSKAAH